MKNIVKSSIEWHDLKPDFKDKKYKVCAIDHPKIELERLSQELGFEYFIIDQNTTVEDVKKEMQDHELLIFLVWQNYAFPFQHDLMEMIDLSTEIKTLVAAVDNQESFGDLNLWGCNKVHLQALLEEVNL